MKSKKLLFSSILMLGGIVTFLTLTSNSAGVMGASTSGCSCHGAASSATTMAISGIPSTGYVAGTAYPVTLSVLNSTKVEAGFDLTVSAGTISNAPTGTMVMSGTELHHTTPGTALSGVTSWSFTWTAPATGSSVNFFVAGNATNNSNSFAGDSWALATIPFIVAAPVATAPSITSVASSAITASGATITAQVNANGASTAVLVQYGTTVSYGSTSTPTPATITGTTATAISSTLTGLVAGTVYHYRVRAINSVDTTFSTDMIFTTGPSGINDRIKTTFSLFPNPTSESMILQSEENIQNASIEIVSLNGTIMKMNISRLNDKQYSISTSSLASGNYLLKATFNGATIIKPFAKK